MKLRKEEREQELTQPFTSELKESPACVSPVMFEEHVSQVFEKFWVFGAEEPAGDLVHHLFELRDLAVVQHGIISAPESTDVKLEPTQEDK